MIDGPVLVLNRSFQPVEITTIKRAICIVFKGLAKVVDSQYRLYDFSSWAEMSSVVNGDGIHLTNRVIAVPRVILLTFYDRLPRRRVRLTRENIYFRDHCTCQYCGRKFSRSELNLDHVVPVSQGGETSWSNIVCSCVPCNQKKGGRTPSQAGLHLLKKPVEPPYSLFMHIAPAQSLLNAWHIYMNPIDYAYWCLELR